MENFRLDLHNAADPDHLYGLIYVNDGLGHAEFYGDALLPDAYGGH
ncbi:hypothetical protein [Nonomuraea rhizosphaerae]|nr:hypothetical protein [Nonomuraea rhizosphaerae]